AVAAVVEAGGVDAAERVNRFAELLTIRREVLHDLKRGGERRDRDEVGGRQLLVHVVVRRPDGALHLFRLHRAQVEEQHDEATAVHVHLGGGCAGGARGPRGVGRGGAVRRRQDRIHLCRRDRGIVGFQRRVELFEIEARHGLRLVVLGDAEVVARQTAYDRAIL